MTARVTFDFAGSRALITGGTSGIGYAAATLFRDAGAQVTITGTKPDPAGYDLDLSGMTYHQLALTDAQSIDDLIASTPELDVLVNNAGANFPGGLDESKPDGFAASVALNLTGPYRLTVGLRHALSKSSAVGGASVVNLTSLSALRAVIVVPGYGASKAGIISLTHNLAVRWAPRRIPGQRRCTRRYRHPDDRRRKVGARDRGSRACTHPVGKVGHTGRGGRNDRIPVHGTQRLHHRRGLHRRRGIHEPMMLSDNLFPLLLEDRYHTGIVVRPRRPGRGRYRGAAEGAAFLRNCRGAIQEAISSSIWLIAAEVPSTTPMSSTCCSASVDS